MSLSDRDRDAWLETIEDPDEREAVEAAFEAVSDADFDDTDDADDFTPFVYPH